MRSAFVAGLRFQTAMRHRPVVCSGTGGLYSFPPPPNAGGAERHETHPLRFALMRRDAGLRDPLASRRSTTRRLFAPEPCFRTWPACAAIQPAFAGLPPCPAALAGGLA